VILPRQGGTEAAPGREIQVEEQEHHDDAEALHDVHVSTDAAKPRENAEHHPVAARQQQRDRGDHPGEEAAEHA